MVFRNPEGSVVVAITYKERYEDTSESTLFFAESVAVNVVGEHKLSEIFKMLCKYVSEFDDIWKWRFLFSGDISDPSMAMYREFCGYEAYMVESKELYVSYSTT